MLKLLVVIPAYNEEESIVSTVADLTKTLPEIDYVVINDGSTDGTLKACITNNIQVLSHPVNLGLTGAFQTGMKYAYRNNYDCVLQFDADGQHLPQFIPTMLECMESTQSDIVIASRFVTQPKPFSLRMMGSSLISFLLQITTGAQIKDPTSGMRLYSKKMIRLFSQRADLSPEPDTLAFLIRKGAHVKEVQAAMQERKAGKSYLTPIKAISYMLNASCSILLTLWFRR